MPKPASRAANQLLEELSHADYGQMFPQLSAVVLSFADVLAEPDATARYVYFPMSGLVAIHTATIGRPSLALVGSEGMIGSSLAAGVAAPFALVVVQGPGTAMRMDARRFRVLADRSTSLQRQMHRYTLRLLGRTSQMAVCNGVHAAEARLARSLLEASDRAHSEKVRITQQQFAYLIGARRGAVSIAATSLRRRGLITYSRGRVRIVDRKVLNGVACACYDNATER